MGGKATFSGTDFQARVGAFFLVHAVARRSLPPFGVPAGVPASVAHETGGAGDDIRLELTNGLALEVQAKHGLQADERLESALEQFATRLKPGEYGILVVDRATSSRTVTESLRDALELWRNDQEPVLQPGLLERVRPLLDVAREDVRKRIAVAVLDLDDDSGGHVQFVLELLRGEMATGNAPEQAWSSLFKIASGAAKKGHRHSRERIVALLAAQHCYVRSEQQQQLESSATSLNAALAPSAPVPFETSAELKVAASLLRRLQPSAALMALRDAANLLGNRYRAEHATLEGVALLQRDQPNLAIDSFERALKEDSCYVPALLNLGTAYSRMGNLEQAAAATNRAAEIEPDSVRVWAARIQGSASPLEVPDALAKESAVVVARVSNALKCARAIPETLLEQLEEDVSRSSDEHAECILIEALCVAAWHSTPLNDALLQRARAVCERLLPRLTDTQLWMRRVVRWRYAQVLEATGRSDDALLELRAVALEDRATPAFAISYAEHALRHRCDIELAVKLVETHASADPFCKALCARLMFVAGDEDAARRLLDEVTSEILPAADNGELRVFAVMAALELQDASRARSLLVDDDTDDVRWSILRARTEVLQDDVDAAFIAYRRAFNVAADLAIPIRLECAALLGRSSRWSDVIDVLEPLSANATDHVKGMLAEACFHCGEYSRASTLAADAGEQVAWSLRLRAFLAIKRFDTVVARALLQRWHELQPTDPAPLLWLAHVCIQSSDLLGAKANLGKVDVASLPTLERLKLSRLLLLAGEPARALNVAYAALREGFHDTNVLEAFLQVRLASRRHLEQIELTVVHEGVAIRLQRASGDTLLYLVTNDADPVKELGEISSAGALGQRLLGRRLGESVDLGDSTGHATIVALGDRSAHAFCWVTEELERRQSSSIESIPLVGPDGEMDPSILFERLAARDQAQAHAFDLVEEKVLPFASAAMVLGRATFEIYSEFILDTNRLVPVESIDCAQGAHCIG